MVIVLAACGGSEPETGNAGAQGQRPGGFPGGFGPGGQQEMPVPAVEVVEARIGSLPLEERLTGRVIAENQSEIIAEVGGPVTEVFVDSGDAVQAGDPLVQIRDTEYRERLNQAQAGLQVAEAQTRQAQANLAALQNQLERIQSLTERRLETVSALEDIQVQVDVAQANVELRRAQENQAQSVVEERRLELANTTVRAPISGMVGQRNVERGQIVSASAPLFIIGDLDDVRIEMLLTERMLTYIREGMSVSLYSENWPDLRFDASVSRISPFLDANTLRTQAYVEMENPDRMLRPGMFLNADIYYGETEDAVLIPNSAIYRHPRTGVEGVYVMTPPGPEARPVSEVDGAPAMLPAAPVQFVPVDVVASGRMSSGVEGIQQGDWVVTIGQNLLMGNVAEARARVMSWDRMEEMQRKQNRDIFDIIDAAREQRQNAVPADS
ncbi:efflux RND transporter periplasmic adaptor subunit [Pseudohongiella nitratireducens]|nr:efflux RND transporter periplasmic adaptor subunit [Pseudohongiella nitratireducens]MDF1623476.1 efflux RND transporter periplasmic adaptor subunit [Pseudohongiella nitratireducens]